MQPWCTLQWLSASDNTFCLRIHICKIILFSKGDAGNSPANIIPSRGMLTAPPIDGQRAGLGLGQARPAGGWAGTAHRASRAVPLRASCRPSAQARARGPKFMLGQPTRHGQITRPCQPEAHRFKKNHLNKKYSNLKSFKPKPKPYTQRTRGN